MFADLQPYICTEDSCKDGFSTYMDRKDWITHEFSHEKAYGNKKFKSCPMCGESIDHLPFANRYSHVASHMENIALTALPLTDDLTEFSSSDEELSIDISRNSDTERLGDSNRPANAFTNAAESLNFAEVDTTVRNGAFWLSEQGAAFSIGASEPIVSSVPKLEK